MREWLADAVARLSDNPLLQGLLAALATFILEDPTTIGCGLLVADGRMAFATALIGVSAGIAVGDAGLYACGRLLGPRTVRWGWVSQARLDRGGEWFGRNLVGAVVLSRFVPGMRLPTYLAAGVLRAPFHRFVAVAVLASVVWTTLLLYLTVLLGEAIMPWLGRFRWPAALVVVALLVLIQMRAARRLEPRQSKAPVVSTFELWPLWLFYIPVAFYWVWLTIRYGGATLPTAANPSIFAGGLIGESKSKILDLVPPASRQWIAPYTVFKRPDGELATVVDGARAAIGAAGLAYPLVAKPDLGQRGDGVRPLRSEDDLRGYLEDFPAGSSVVFQKLVGPGREHGGDPGTGPSEAGILYWRQPQTERGEIFSITLKEFPRVVGDGRSTLRQLVEADPRARLLADIYLERHAAEVDRVLDEGESFGLVFSGNHCKGAVFLDGTHLATPALLDRVEGIARAMPEFYFGRFDARFSDLDAFLRGEDLTVVEINGAGAEATHIWDARVRLVDAYRALFRQFRVLFSIGAANRRRGHRPLGLFTFMREFVAYRRLARCYPGTH